MSLLRSILKACKCAATSGQMKYATSSKKKIFVTTPNIPVNAIEFLKQKHEISLHTKLEPISKEALIDGLRDADAVLCVVTDAIDKKVLDAAGPNLKAIATMSVGFDHIDVKTCKSKGIQVGHTPNVSVPTVAEYTITLLLAAGRRLHEAEHAIRNGEWINTWDPTWLCGQGIHDSVVGIVGMGRIGQAIFKRLLPFEAKKILYYDSFHPIKEAESLGAVYAPFEELAKESDFISANCNLSPETYHIFNKKAFGLMKPNAIFVNTSRGGVVNQEDLYEALKNKKILGAALDVFEPEPLPKDHALTTLNNIILTPHVGSAEWKVREAMAKLAAENILNALEGKSMPAPVKS